MRVGLDCRTITAPKTGDRTYALNLSRALAELASQEPERLELFLYVWERTQLTDGLGKQTHGILLPAQPRWTWTPVVFPQDLRRRRLDLAHVQYLVPPIAPCPVITTVHDVAFRRFPHLFPLKHRVLLNALIPGSVRNAAVVLTGSEATRSDLLEFYGLPEDKVVVTPYAADPIYQPMDPLEARKAVRRRLGIPGPYLLSVGVLQPRKNLPRLVRAYNRIASRYPHRLVLVGKEGWAPDELRAAVAASPPGREPIFTGYVADADLPALYAGADLFVYPSLYEGFGLPPLEAMACGAPVVTSNTSSLPEVVGDAGITLDPMDERGLAETLSALLEDPERRSALGAAGLVRSRSFSWKRCAQETLAVYERVMAGEFSGSSL